VVGVGLICVDIGLTLIAGHLLLLSPEEDAFWIFVSLMDTHLRPYFSSNTTQLEVDAALFSRALESNDAQVAKKVLVDMGISPVSVCYPWYVEFVH
jgi:Rab-GTPase-TBC domain